MLDHQVARDAKIINLDEAKADRRFRHHERMGQRSMKMPKYTHGYIDQHGRPRFYLRRAGHKKIPLPGLPWSPEFMAAREAALKGEWSKPEIGAQRLQ